MTHLDREAKEEFTKLDAEVAGINGRMAALLAAACVRCGVDSQTMD